MNLELMCGKCGEKTPHEYRGYGNIFLNKQMKMVYTYVCLKCGELTKSEVKYNQK